MAKPLAAGVFEACEKLAGVAGVAHDVVVDEDERARGHGADFGHDLVDGAGAVGAAEEGRDGAVSTVEGAAASGLHHVGQDVAFWVDEVAAGRWEAAEFGPGFVLIELFQLAALGVAHDLGPLVLGFADDDGVGVLGGFFGQSRGVDAADYHADATAAKVVGDLVGAGGCGRGACDADEVGIEVFGDFGDAFVDDGDVVAWRGQAGDGQQAQRWEDRSALWAVRKIAGGRLPRGYQDYFHGHSPLGDLQELHYDRAAEIPATICENTPGLRDIRACQQAGAATGQVRVHDTPRQASVQGAVG